MNSTTAIEQDDGVKVFHRVDGWTVPYEPGTQTCTINHVPESEGRRACTAKAVWKVVEQRGFGLTISFWCDDDLPAEHRHPVSTPTPGQELHQAVARELVAAVIAEAGRGASVEFPRLDAALAAIATLTPPRMVQAAVDIACTAAEALALLAEQRGIPTADAFAWVLLQREQKVTP